MLGACYDAVLLAPGAHQISRDVTEDNHRVRVVTDFLGLPTGSFTSISALGYVPDTADPIHAHLPTRGDVGARQNIVSGLQRRRLYLICNSI